MGHIYYFSSDDRKDRASVKTAIQRPEQHGHRRYAKSCIEFWDGKLYTRRHKRAYRTPSEAGQ